MLVSKLASHHAQMVAVGADHTVVPMRTGIVFSWGLGGSGQLGLGRLGYIFIPEEVRGESFFGGAKIGSVACGKNTTALLTTLGRLYTCGKVVFERIIVESEGGGAGLGAAYVDVVATLSVLCVSVHTVVIVQVWC